MGDFVFESDTLALPMGASALTHRQRLRLRGQTVLALTQGKFRNYIYPLLTPAGFAVSSERPADHPHHSSMWIGSDHVNALVAAASGTIEEYTYNFYVDETFQGRAPGRIVETGIAGRAVGAGRFEIVQRLEWRGPPEWAAAQGRLVAGETRTLTITQGPTRYRIDLASRLECGECAMRLGPTRHAFFNVRVADSMIVANGGKIIDDRGRISGADISGEGARWVDFTGPVGGGQVAGMTVIARVSDGRMPFWFAADWGVVTVGPFRTKALDLGTGQSFESHHTVLVHDGQMDAADIEAELREQAA